MGRDGTQTEQHWRQEVRLCPHGPVPHFSGACLPRGWCWAGADGQHGRSRARARGSAAPRSRLQPCWTVALLLAGWSTAFILADVLGRAQTMCAGKSVSISAPGSRYSWYRRRIPVSNTEPRPTAQRKRQACFPPVLQCDLPVHWRHPSKKAPGGCIFFHAVREGCGTRPGESAVYAARCQPTGHPGPSATLEIVT